MVISMVENFKITAFELKRQLKISIYLPKNYNIEDKKYPVIYFLDAQVIFASVDDKDKEIDLPSILNDSGLECICVGIHSPKNEEWKISELVPYFKRNESKIDPSLSFIFINYLINNLHSLLGQRYRFNDDVFIFGFNEGAILALYSVGHYKFFKGGAVFSPRLDLCDGYLRDINDNFTQSSPIYLFFGGKNTENSNSFYNLFTALEERINDKVKLIYEENLENNLSSWKQYILDAIKYLLP